MSSVDDLPEEVVSDFFKRLVETQDVDDAMQLVGLDDFDIDLKMELEAEADEELEHCATCDWWYFPTQLVKGVCEDCRE